MDPLPGCIGAFIAEMDYGLAPCVAEAIEEATERGALGYIPDPWKKGGRPLVRRMAAPLRLGGGSDVHPPGAGRAGGVRSVPARDRARRQLHRGTDSGLMPFLSVPRLYGVEVLEIPMLCAGAGEQQAQ